MNSGICIQNLHSFYLFIYLFIYLFTYLMVVLGLRFCARALSSCGKRGPLFIVVRGPLTIVASLVAEHRLQMRRLSNCGSRASSICGMWDLPRPGLEPVSPALAGRFSTTAPPGKPRTFILYHEYYTHYLYRIAWLRSQPSVYLQRGYFLKSLIICQFTIRTLFRILSTVL